MKILILELIKINRAEKQKKNVTGPINNSNRRERKNSEQELNLKHTKPKIQHVNHYINPATMFYIAVKKSFTLHRRN